MHEVQPQMEYPELVLEEKINGATINLIGVRHRRSSFYRYKHFFSDNIKNSPALFLEEDEEDFSYGFYGEIARVAREENIPLYVIVPSELSHLLLEVVQGGAGLIFGTSYLRGLRNMQRRDFLKKGIQSALGLFLLSGTAPARQWIQDAVGDEQVKIDDVLTYGTVADYRNIIAAENIDRASRNYPGGRIPCFIGGGHVKGISAYLRNPELRRKRALYLPQDWTSDTSVRKYEFQESRWKLTERI